MRNERGITLLALVITIIVLLILAVVSIAMLVGDDGFLTKPTEPTDAQTTTMQKSNEDIVKLAIEDLLTEYHAGGAIANNITNTNNTPSTLEINKNELKDAIYRTTSDADISDVTDEFLNIAEDDSEEEISVIKVDFTNGQDIYVLPTTGQIVTEQSQDNG